MRLFFQKYGQGSPLVILHGLFGSFDNWHMLSRPFAPHFKVFALDLRNHGRSPHSEIFHYEAMANDVREFLDDQGLPPAFVIGHSMGGKTAMRLALDHPGLIRRLVIVDIAPKEYPGHHDEILDALTGLDFHKLAARKEIDAALSDAIPNVATRQFLLKNLKRDENGKFGWKMNLDVIRKNYDEMNSPIESVTPFTKPTLFLRSTTSGHIGNEDYPMMRRLFPNLTVTDLDVGHWVHAEAPEHFAAIVLDFFNQPD